jgi:toxin ParE1/3/4
VNLRYTIEVATAAYREAEQYRAYIRERSNDGIAAVAWWDGLMAALESLETIPSRCPRIPEQQHFEIPLHHLLYHSHRIIFSITGRTVVVARIYHAASRPL